jgi:antitoxin VapB
MQRAKIFTNGSSQAIRLPKKYRFKTKEVNVSRLGESVVLTPISKSWQEMFDKMEFIPNNDFLNDREDLKPQEREFFK